MESVYNGLPAHSREKASKEIAYIVCYHPAHDIYSLEARDTRIVFTACSRNLSPTGRSILPGHAERAFKPIVYTSDCDSDLD